ncbi:MAG: trypsin-like peptidase domain-containing protein [Opitutales bacterium]
MRDTQGRTGARGFDNLRDSVVRLDVWEATYDTGAMRLSRGVGSGVIMSPEGYILTNAHVVNPYAERIRITLANLEVVPATFIGWDHWTDLAVVQLDRDELRRRNLKFSHARFGDSSELAPGKAVFAVGTPNGLTRTITRGILSNTERFFEGRNIGRGYETGNYNTWLQTDAAINPGNSGGPLVTGEGRVIGINTRAYLGANNLGFAVPSNVAQRVFNDLIAGGRVERSYIGISLGALRDLESYFGGEITQGAVIQGLDAESPGDRAGLLPGDLLLAMDGEPVDGRFPEQLPAIMQRIASKPVGSELTVEILRSGRRRIVRMPTESLESRLGTETAFAEWGLAVRELSTVALREKRLDAGYGVEVIGVQRAFPAARANLSTGDIITAVNRQPLNDLEMLGKWHAAFAQEPRRMLFEVTRNGQVQLLVLRPGS